MPQVSLPGLPIKMVFREKYNVSNSSLKKSNDHSVVQVSQVTEKKDQQLKSKPTYSSSSRDDRANSECGFFCWQPQALQGLARSLWTFVGFYGFASLCLAASGFYIRSQMTSMERHFRVSTGKMGILMAANDIGSVAAVMFVSHFGKFSHIPRLLGAVTFLGGFFITAIALIQPFDPVRLPTVAATITGNASSNSNDPLANVFNNPMLLCIDRPPFLKLMIGDNGEMDFTKMEDMMSSFSNGGNNMDMANVMEMMGNAPGADGMDMAKMMEMMGNSPGGGGNMDMEKLAEMMGNSPGNEGGVDLEKLAEMMGNSPGGGGNIDIAKLMEMMGNQTESGNAMDMEKLTEMMGNSAGGGGNMDMAKMIEMMGNSPGGGEGMDMAKMMEMMGNSPDGGEGMDMAKMMEMMGNPPGGGEGIDMAKMMDMIGVGEGGNQDMAAMMSMMGMMGNESGSIQWGFYYTFVIMVIIGVLGSPRMPLQLFYIESNVKDKTESGVKIGALNTAMMFGGPMALLIGFPIGMLPVDLVDTEMSFMDPRWIGAWWMGFAIFGVASMIFSLPIFCLPKRIRSSEEADKNGSLKEKRPSMSLEDKNFSLKKQGSYDLRPKDGHRLSNASQLSRLSITAQSGVHALKEFFSTTCKILTQPLVVLMLLVTFCMILGVSGTISFQIKYIENQYDMPAYKISLYLGLGSLGTILIGVFLGGALTTRLKLGLLGMFRLSLIGNLLGLACSISFLFLGCDNHEIVGYNWDLGNVTDMGCQCFSQALLVVCGEDGRNYLSPCLAGCAEADGLSFKKCAYVGGQGTAVPGFCQNCDQFPIFLALFTLMTMCMLVTITPHMLMTARLVPLRDQPNVTALTSVVFTVGMLVGPIIFGMIYDSTCSLWHPFSEMCVVPDKVALREVFIASDVYILAGGAFLLIIATILVHCQREKYEQFSKTETEKANPNFTTKRPQKSLTHKDKPKNLPDIGAKGWRKTLSHMMVEDSVGEPGVLGVSYGRRISNPFPDIRRVSFDSSAIKNQPEHGDIPKLTSFEKGEKDTGLQQDKKLEALDVDNGYDSVSSKSDDNNCDSHVDDAKDNSSEKAQRDQNSLSEENIEDMFNVDDL